MRKLGRLAWLSIGFLSLTAGIIGIFLPVWPTTVFIIIASFSFANSSPRLHKWLLNHRYFGPTLRDWETHGRIPRRAKLIAVTAIAVSAGLLLLTGCPTWAKLLTCSVLIGVTAFILTRPS